MAGSSPAMTLRATFPCAALSIIFRPAPKVPSMSAQVFDVVVVGGGHAGCEAAAASARMGARTALLTHRFETVGEMSCNPAIGGLGKGHLVREIDALDGLMGRVADRAGIQFRMLNRSKGPPCRGRAPRRIANCTAGTCRRPSLPARARCHQEQVEDLIVENGAVAGVITGSGREVRCGAAVITTGTFLKGVIHLGETRIPAGRIGEAPAIRLSERLYALGLRMGRLKTGTPARLDGRTIDYSMLEAQPGDEPPVPFSFLTAQITTPQVPCHITATTPETHAIITAEYPSRADVFGADREHRPALLSIDRGQGCPLQGSRKPSDLSGARGSRRSHCLSERHLDLASGRRSARLPEDDPRPAKTPP